MSVMVYHTMMVQDVNYSKHALKFKHKNHASLQHHYNNYTNTVMTIVHLFIMIFMQFAIDSNYTFMVCNFPVIGYSDESGVQTIAMRKE